MVTKNIIGEKFGRLQVYEYSHSAEHRNFWRCKCDCGNEVIKYTKQLTSMKCQSCGCIHKEVLIKRNKENATHGLSSHNLYKVWQNMIFRCTLPSNKSYARYGGRGIKVCEKWLLFENFYSDLVSTYVEGLQLDRINNDGDYEPSNCRWATDFQQRRNKSKNIYIEYNGENKIVADWARTYDIRPETLLKRIKRGFDFYEALTLPLHMGKKIRTI